MTEDNSTGGANNTGSTVIHLVKPFPSADPSSFAQRAHPSSLSPNIMADNLANHYRDNLGSMSLEVLKRHAIDLEMAMQAFERNSLPLTEHDRMEIAESLKLLNERIDELLPTEAANVEAHDYSIGARITQSWPIHLNRSTMRMHMHFCELLYSWNLSPFKRERGVATVDELAETEGLTRFYFHSKADAGNFIDHFGLEDFVTVEPSQTGTLNELTGRPFWFLHLTNKFDTREVHEFLGVYMSAINALKVIYDERRRAVTNDNGQIGFVTAEHFTSREVMELSRIRAAREKLGVGFKELNNGRE